LRAKGRRQNRQNFNVLWFQWKWRGRMIIITRFDCVWMQTQKSPKDPHINFQWNRRPLTIWQFCWQPFWKWWPRRNDPECKLFQWKLISRVILKWGIDW
jgi:hypothetical protein